MCGIHDQQWARIVMDDTTDRFVRGLDVQRLDVLEISGDKWGSLPFRSYSSRFYPDFDICDIAAPTQQYDLIIAEQVLEHVLWPYRAVKNIYSLLRPNGVLVVTTPFLLRVHPCPHDLTRWTEEGMRYLLAEAGFILDNIETGSWGNRACVIGNFRKWAPWVSWYHSLKNEPLFPVVVWAFARKS